LVEFWAAPIPDVVPWEEVVFPHSQPANSDIDDRLPPDAPRPYPLSQAGPVADGFPDVQVVQRDAQAFFPVVFRSKRRVLRWRLRGIAGMAIKPGLQLVDLLLQLGYSIQRLAQGILPKQDISLNFCRKFSPSLRSNRPWLHKTMDKPFFTK